MIRIAVCDDVPCAAKTIKDLLIIYNFGEGLEIDCFEHGSQLYTQFIKKRYDILITDIELTPDGYSSELLKNGMLLADEIKEMYPEVIVIFLSRFSYEKELLRHEPFGFIDKPNLGNDKRITDIVEKAIRKLRNRAERETVFWFKTKGVSLGKAIKEIVYFESNRPRIRLVTIDDEFIFRGRLDQVQEKIEKSAENFIRVNKSYYINIRCIKGYTSKEITMINDAVIPISRKYLEEFRKKINDLC
ncbi:MAG: LytTR family DNA-binding domain-containing protein [Acetatifactor sp.]|nr:LytTR family DNA-binding domain-containing protein [Acetatifactor sp.]